MQSHQIERQQLKVRQTLQQYQQQHPPRNGKRRHTRQRQQYTNEQEYGQGVTQEENDSIN